ncbi:MAG: hypothetical protein ACR2PT_15445 [Endozoicomonas sp.]
MKRADAMAGACLSDAEKARNSGEIVEATSMKSKTEAMAVAGKAINYQSDFTVTQARLRALAAVRMSEYQKLDS